MAGIESIGGGFSWRIACWIWQNRSSGYRILALRSHSSRRGSRGAPGIGRRWRSFVTDFHLRITAGILTDAQSGCDRRSVSWIMANNTSRRIIPLCLEWRISLFYGRDSETIINRKIICYLYTVEEVDGDLSFLFGRHPSGLREYFSSASEKSWYFLCRFSLGNFLLACVGRKQSGWEDPSNCSCQPFPLYLSNNLNECLPHCSKMESKFGSDWREKIFTNARRAVPGRR